MTKRALAVVAVLGVLTAGCGGGQTTAVKPVGAPSALPSTAAPSLSPSASPSPKPTTNPLTGLAPQASPVVVIKVDNAVTARRYHRGLGQAAVIYQELVESGQTRLAAVYDNAYAGEVGPIRSVRETDIELLAQFGRVAVASSGGNTGVKKTFSQAVAAGKLLDASYDVLPSRYRLAERRADARNFFSTPAKLAAASHAALSQDIGLRFGPLAPTAGQPVSAASMRFSDVMYMGARYSASTGTWSISQDGRAMTGVAPANVIVQYVTIKNSKYVDVLGAPTPYTVTTGTGNALIMRDGRAVKATWRRLNSKTGTRYVDDKGRDIPLKAGPTWIVLLPKSRTAALS